MSWSQLNHVDKEGPGHWTPTKGKAYFALGAKTLGCPLWVLKCFVGIWDKKDIWCIKTVWCNDIFIYRWSICWLVPTIPQDGKHQFCKCLGVRWRCSGQRNLGFLWAISGGMYNPVPTLAAVYWNLVCNKYNSLLCQPGCTRVSSWRLHWLISCL